MWWFDMFALYTSFTAINWLIIYMAYAVLSRITARECDWGMLAVGVFIISCSLSVSISILKTILAH